MKKYKHIGLAALLSASLGLAACAGISWPQVGSQLLTDVQDGTVLATEAYAAYSAVNQQLTTANVTTGKLDATKVLAAATAVNSGLQTPGLATAVNQLVADANATIKTLQAANVATPTVINTVSQSGATVVSTIKTVTTTP